MKTIRELREEHGLTQLQLAYRVGVTPLTIANWERGRTEPKATQLRKVAEVFGLASSDDIVLVHQEADMEKAAA